MPIHGSEWRGFVSLYDFVPKIYGQDPLLFAQSYDHPLLLYQRGEELQDTSWTFRTKTITSLHLVRYLETNRLRLSAELGQYQVCPVVKADTNPWSDRITLGRASNNDIVLPDASISKIHAYLSQSPEKKWLLTDGGSRNGTFVNGEQLLSKQQTVLSFGDRLLLGNTLLIFHDARSFYDFVAQRVAVRQPSPE